MKNKVITAQQAAALVNDGSTVCTIGMTLIGAAESILKALEQRFLATGSPANLTYIHSAGQSNRERGNQHFAHPGMVKRIIGSHWGLAPKWMERIASDSVEAFCLPQGQIVHLYTAMAAGQAGYLSKVGLGTFIDPRLEGGKMNDRTRALADLVEVVSLRGEEYLFYPALPLDTVIIRGTTADAEGNLTCEEEAMKLEILQAVLAAKRFGGKVLAQVKNLAQTGSLHPKQVVVPGNFIDAVVVCDNPEQDHRQTSSWFYDPAYCGNLISPTSELEKLPLTIRKLIGRRACQFLYPGCVINLGTGIPNDVIGTIIHEEEVSDDITITVESGIYGGVQAGGIDFGIGKNLTAMINHQEQMLYYNGTGVDITYMGAGEMDANGHINATKMGDRCTGAGGFIDITQNAHHVVFCSTFTTKGLEVEFRDGQLRILREGSVKKLVKDINQISYNGEIARQKKQKMHLVTERAVFELTEQGPMLIEIAPGIDLEKDVLQQMEFTPLISESLKLMDASLFEEVNFGLKHALCSNEHTESNHH
ncbi:acyl CoA:acetate/3-ketoacid CoA transferase [Pragia fontium]|uniref:Acetate CoA-transferase YdiF n=1 Tax=Pragia fontium DSM 5563 = ATCC 49100 TaxID=1122977 RepID=A0AAJ5BIA9_9GAMM|nr:CoA-transferase [Pragia fontium]SFD26767.1 propionate CoA-transferase [Pragia fontium DSM 5563 = ATCC 49100]